MTFQPSLDRPVSSAVARFIDIANIYYVSPFLAVIARSVCKLIVLDEIDWRYLRDTGLKTTADRRRKFDWFREWD